MHLVQHGSGPERYLGLHGWSGSHCTFDPLVPYLPPEVTLFAADLPGCGESPAMPWRLEAVSGALAGTIRSLAPVTVIGQCSGGLLGMHASLGCGIAAQRLVLIDPLAYWPWYFRVFTAGRVGHRLYRAAFANRVGRRLTNAGLRGRRAGETDLTDGFRTSRHEVLLGHLEVLRQIPDARIFRELRMPIDIVFGRRTFRAVHRSAAVWRSIWPQATITEIAEAGHLPLQEATAELSRIIFRNR